MMRNGQSIDSGDNSTNIQGREVYVNNYGPSYSEVKEIAMDVFKSNFYDLGEKVEKIVQERAEKLLDDYLEKLRDKNPEYINNTQEPDIRYVIYEAQKNYARRGEELNEKLLVETLVNRTAIQGNSIQELVLNAALEIIPKLTSKQIDILSLIFLNQYAIFKSHDPINIYCVLNSVIRSGMVIDRDSSLFQHLEYASCIAISIGRIDYNRVIKGKFPNVNEGEEMQKIINGNKELVIMSNMWNNSQLCNSRLTSVGIAIAIANIKIKTGLECDLGIWIKE